jgi:hypothetical protein
MPKRAEPEILEDIRRVYTSLSPENLTCDGELSPAVVKTKKRRLQEELRKLFAELGRQVGEEEAFLEAP